MSADKIRKSLDLVFETLPGPVVLLNKELEIVDSNTIFSELFENLPSSLESLTGASDLSIVAAEIQNCFSQQDAKAKFTTCFLKKKDVRIWIEWTAKSDGHHCVLVGTDTTSYRRTMEELRNQRQQFENKKKSEDLFVAKMNHELRTPLNAIIGYSQILLRSGLDDTGVDHVQRIRHNGKKLLRQIDNVLSIADLESTLNIEKIDLFPLLQSVVNEFECSLADVDLKVVIEDQRPQSPIDADYSSLHHVVRNLLDNAIKFSSKGSIKLVVQSEQLTAIALHIVDEGVGVCEENIDSIFAPFQKGALLVNDCGVGLGLSVARKLCLKMGFELNLRPAEVGSKFTIIFQPVQ